MIRCCARLRSASSAARTRTRSRTASSAADGTRTGVSSPARCSRASRLASRLSVFTRSPGRRGISDGATTSHEDFEAHIGELRAACYARDARVTRNPRWSQLVTIDIIRRDTLAATQSVPSPLQALGPARPRPELAGRNLPPKAARDLARINPTARNAP